MNDQNNQEFILRESNHKRLTSFGFFLGGGGCKEGIIEEEFLKL